MGFTQTPTAHEKVCDKNESRRIRKNGACLKMFLMEGKVYKVHAEESCHGYQ